MKILLLIFSLLTLSNTYAGDRYLNCGFGSVETMDEFISSDIINGDRALSKFTIRDNDYIRNDSFGLRPDGNNILIENLKYKYVKNGFILKEVSKKN